VTGIKEVGHTEIQPLLCCAAEAVAVMTGLAMRVMSCYWQIQPEKLCNCHICFAHCVLTIRLVSEYSGGNFAPADLIIMIVKLMGMVSVLL